MSIIFLALVFGIAAGYFKIFPEKFVSYVPRITMIGLSVLLAAMGMQIGSDPALINNIFSLGVKALIIAAGTIAGSLLFLGIVRKWIEKDCQKTIKNLPDRSDHEGSGIVSWVLCLAIILGILLSLVFEPNKKILDLITELSLWLIIWAIGLDLGHNHQVWQGIRVYGWKIVLVPISIAAGSIIGAVVTGLPLGLAVNESSAVGAGFGWYSLAGVLISRIYNVEIGTISFLSNIFRELLAIVFIPQIAKRQTGILCIAPGGATTMDTTMPVISQAAGPGIALVGFVSGFMLSIMVPVLVPLLIRIPF